MLKCCDCGNGITDGELHAYRNSAGEYSDFCERCCPECKVIDLYGLGHVYGTYPHMVVPTENTPFIYYTAFTPKPTFVSLVVDWHQKNGNARKEDS